ncbi:hypothetical protein [Amycolatopsis azurea]|uniref:hypothetical protein n=1 Tax=Amycolatopsis azurea TaxID=36819 RepID=UPI001FD7346F|nr:hypothetical protein [Amycolatopsis azurea]
MEDYRGLVDDGELVVAGGQATPLLEQIEPALDNVAAAVVHRFEREWATTA